MIVWGYDDEKNTVPVDLSIERIVNQGVDPWRLDLFDEEPIALWVWVGWQPRRLKFRKIRDVSFAYQGKDSRIYVGVHDGANATCIRGKLVEVDGGNLIVDNLEASKSPFNRHFAEYLQTYERARVTKDAVISLSDGTFIALYNYSSNAVRINGKRLTFGSRGASGDVKSLYPRTFVGEMLRHLPVSAVLPRGVMWALEQFRPWNPIIFGAALRPFAIQPMNMQVLLAEKDFPAALAVVSPAAKTFYPSELKWEGWSFDLLPKESFEEPVMRLTVTGWNMSMDLRFCHKPGELQCSRIALFDLGRKQARAMDTDGWKMSEEYFLKKEGFNPI